MNRRKWALVALMPTFLLLSGCEKPTVGPGRNAATSSPAPTELAHLANTAISLPQIETRSRASTNG